MRNPGFYLFLLGLLPVPCFGFDWGDFHKVSVVIGTILGFGLGFFAICLVIYFACLRPFFDNFKEEVTETHRTWHPWPIGSVRWQIQQLVRSSRSGGGTHFPTTPPAIHKGQTTQYLNVPSLQNTLVQPAPYVYGRATDEIPIIRSTEYSAIERSQQPRSTSSYLYQEQVIDRPTYFTPSPGLFFKL
ncbi:hypothetical protein FO519_006728 [Halicephalobus sp. NKZ332]|nr:hypothetical protein FO519_006728 [Halicephalobus sp. NKZ332]